MVKVKRVCQQCGKVFFAKNGDINRGKAKFCSRECATASRKTKTQHTCKNCGKPFEVILSDHLNNKGVFCSRTCFKSYSKIQNRCKTCGKIIITTTSKNQIYCSSACKKESRLAGEYRVCPVCGKSYYVTKYRIKNQTVITCSTTCYAKYKKNTSPLNTSCIICGKFFHTAPYRAGVVKCCSNVCRAKYQNKQITTICKQCGKVIKKKRSGKQQNSFCSQTCYNKYQRKQRITKTCEICGKTFQTSTSKWGKKYCSKNCAGKYRRSIAETFVKRGENHPNWTGGKQKQKERVWKKEHISPIRFKPISTEELNKILSGDDEE